MLGALESPKSRPFPNFRDAHAPIRLPTHRDLVQPRSRVQAGAESVAAPLVSTHASNVEVLPSSQLVNAVGDLAVFARLLDSRTEVGVSQRDAGSISARGIDNLPGRHRTVSVDPVALSPTVCSGRIGDLFTVAVLLCWCELSHCLALVQPLATADRGSKPSSIFTRPA